MNADQIYRLSFLIAFSKIQTLLDLLGDDVKGVQLARVEARSAEPTPEHMNGHKPRHRRSATRGARGKSAGLHMFEVMLSEGQNAVWHNDQIWRRLRTDLSIKGKSTGPSIICRAVRSGHVERVGPSEYRLTDKGRSATAAGIMNAINTARGARP